MLRNFFETPSSFEGDPRGFLKNQVGHLGIVGSGMVVVSALLSEVFGAPAWTFALPFLVGYAIWEILQWGFYAAEAWDGVEDFAFVYCGVMSVLLLSPALGFLGVLFLWSGYLRRAST